MQVHQLMLMESRGGMIGALLAFAIAAWYCPKRPSTLTVLGLGVLAGIALAGPPWFANFSRPSMNKGTGRLGRKPILSLESGGPNRD